ncbi:hypothetical protein [Limnoglobus roseus]|uniref:Uncharacterized protein n=1 Tax=Limnoglobus roseus TaxID=2598579 RepID=A0A5C1AJB6_9BACT|nr:hypothetical protein [Limnoglobus roseus]QEL18960.1 hypothetical protein PX52LOC_06010 [Limnoglobus roseus]
MKELRRLARQFRESGESMAEPLDVDEMRQTLARVSVYRQVCERVRNSSGHTIFTGLMFLGIAYLQYTARGGFDPFVIGPLVIGGGELLVGLWKRLRPSPECVLLDGLLQAAFVGSVVIREFLRMQGKGNFNPDPISVVIVLWFSYDAFNTFSYYFALRKLFVERPSAEHLAYVDDLTDEIATGDPHTDPAVIEIPTKPRLKAKLLGDVAFFYDYRSKELFLCARDEMLITRQVRGSDDQQGVLTILHQQFPPFPLDSASWNNYANWKTAGGQPPRE